MINKHGEKTSALSVKDKFGWRVRKLSRNQCLCEVTGANRL